MANTIGRAAKRFKGFATKEIPPSDAQRTGEFVKWRDWDGNVTEKPVYTETRPVYEKHIARDEDGEIVWKLNKNGEKLRKRTVLTQAGTETREFILVDTGTGKVEKNYDFRGDPNEAKRREQAEVRKQKLEQLMDVMAEKDIDPEDLLGAIQAEPQKRGKAKAKAEA